jgi:phenol 2-monooxygenase
MHRIDREVGCMIIVRPDQYVAHVLPLNGYEALTLYFARFMLPESDQDTLSMAAT